MPWRNGGGVTTELWIAPPGAALDAFDWRLSMARIDALGPFSTFPGIDRVLAVLEGRLRLRIEGGPHLELGPGDPAVAFPGERAVEGTPLAGPVLDLNLMLRRSGFKGALQRIELAHATRLTPDLGITALLSRSEAVAWEWEAAPAGSGRLDRNDLLIGAASGSAIRLCPHDGAAAALYRIDVRPR